jgi:hypothetical protein
MPVRKTIQPHHYPLASGTSILLAAAYAGVGDFREATIQGGVALFLITILALGSYWEGLRQ